MKKLVLTVIILGTICSITTQAQLSPKEKGLQAITLDAIRGQLEFLSSDWMEGRATGERGFYLASDYVASMFRVFGAAPAGDAAMGVRGRFIMIGNPPAAPAQPAAPAANPPAPNQPTKVIVVQGGPLNPGVSGFPAGQSFTPTKSYFQNFTLIESQPAGGSILTIKKGGQEYIFKEGIDFSLSRATMDVKFDAPVVFVGYGIVDKPNGIDDFAGVDVKGKVIIRLPGFPGFADNTSPMYKKLVGDNRRAQFEIQRKKSEAITNLGVLGVIELTTNNTDAAKRWGTYKFDNIMAPAEISQRGSRVSMRLDGKEVTSNPASVTLTERVSNYLIKEGGLDIVKYEKDAATGTLKFKPVPLPGLTAGLIVSVNTKRINSRNVIAIIEGENPNEYVAVGAHMDHMGMYDGKIWNGADDNASGTVAVMTLAKAFIASGIKPKRSIVFCAWTGEEEGLLGSEYYTIYPAIGKISDYKFYLNFDMISRDATNDTEKNMAGFTYTKAYPKIEEITRTNADNYKINLKLDIKSEEQPRGGSDFEAFAANKIPIVEWMAAMHSDYHMPSDEASLVNWNKMLEIIRLGYLQLWDIANGELK